MTSLDLESFYDFEEITEISISKNGERIAVIVDEFDSETDARRRSLYVTPIDGTGEPHRLTRASSASSPRWSPDGNRLGFLAARRGDLGIDDGDGDDDQTPETQVWSFDLSRGGDARQITTMDEGVRSFDWAPRDDRIVVAARDPTDEQREYLDRREDGGPIVTERLQHKYDGQGWLDDVRTYLFVVDVETRDERRLDDAYGGGGPFQAEAGPMPTWSPRGDRIAFLSNRTKHPDDSHVNDVYTIRPDGSDLEKLTDSDLTASRLRWNPDGTRVAFAKRHLSNWYIPTRACVGDVEEGSYRSVSKDLDRHVDQAGAIGWVDDETLLAPVSDGGRARLVRFHADGSSPERVFAGQGEYRTVADLDVRGGTAAVVLSAPDEGPNLHVLDPSGSIEDPERRLTDLNRDLVDDHDMPGCRRIRYENEAGDQIEGIVYHPPDFDPADPDRRPVVTSIHGGPIWYDAPEFRFDDAYWTGRGYLVFHPNYRGSSSYGREFSETIRGDWGPREVEDIASGVRSLLDRGWGEPSRQFVTGFSYGGISTAWLVARTDLFTAAAAEHGDYDFYSAFGTDDSHKWAEHEYGLPWENPEAYREMSTVDEVTGIDAPTLVTAGGQDWRCPPTQAEQFYVSLKKAGVESKLVVYPTEHHRRLYDVEHPDLVIHRLRTLTEWFEKHDPGA